MEELTIGTGGKREKYEALLPQVEAVMDGEADIIANMANVAAMLRETFGFWWVGFYRVLPQKGIMPSAEGLNDVASAEVISEGTSEQGQQLVLGPFQGPLACTRIAYGRGVCGMAWKERQTIIVPDVDKFPGHIACSSASRSEIVVPIFSGEEVVAVLDIDSAELNTFDEVDAFYLQKIVETM